MSFVQYFVMISAALGPLALLTNPFVVAANHLGRLESLAVNRYVELSPVTLYFRSVTNE